MPTVTLLIKGVRTIPTAERIYVFQSGKEERCVPEEVAVRCEKANDREKRTIFQVVRGSAVVSDHGVISPKHVARLQASDLMPHGNGQLEFPGWC